MSLQRAVLDATAGKYILRFKGSNLRETTLLSNQSDKEKTTVAFFLLLSLLPKYQTFGLT